MRRGWPAATRRADQGSAAHRRQGAAVRRGRDERTEDLVARGRAASRDRLGLRRRAGARGKGDHRLARRARHHPGRPSRPAGPGPAREDRGREVRHYTSRAGDPHRHLHLQINARVFAAGKWRGLHTSASATASTPSTASATPLSSATPTSDRRSRPTATPSTPRRRGRRARRVHRPVQRPGGADRPQRRPLRGRVARGAPGGARTGAAAGVGCPGMGRGAPGQGRAASGGELPGGGWRSWAGSVTDALIGRSLWTPRSGGWTATAAVQRC